MPISKVVLTKNGGHRISKLNEYPLHRFKKLIISVIIFKLSEEISFALDRKVDAPPSTIFIFKSSSHVRHTHPLICPNPNRKHQQQNWKKNLHPKILILFVDSKPQTQKRAPPKRGFGVYRLRLARSRAVFPGLATPVFSVQIECHVGRFLSFSLWVGVI